MPRLLVLARSSPEESVKFESARLLVTCLKAAVGTDAADQAAVLAMHTDDAASDAGSNSIGECVDALANLVQSNHAILKAEGLIGFDYMLQLFEAGASGQGPEEATAMGVAVRDLIYKELESIGQSDGQSQQLPEEISALAEQVRRRLRLTALAREE